MKKIKKYLFTLLITITAFSCGINYINAEGLPGEILVSKSANKEDSIYGRNATINLGINANAFTEVNKTDVVLVLDRSNSMNGTKMSDTKKAAIDLIDLLINDTTKEKISAGIVTYGDDVLTSYTSKSLTNNANSLKEIVNNIVDTIYVTPNYNGEGTNVHAGLIKANSLLSTSKQGTKKIVILLSDGEPTFYIGSNGSKICGNGKNDRENYENGCTVNGNKRPSTVANAYATTMKNTNKIDIYTVGFDISNDNDAKRFLNNISSNPDTTYSYLANDYSGLKKAFEAMVKNFSVVATNAKVVDIIPKEFDIKESSLPSNINVNKKIDGTTELTWNIGDISSISNNTLSYVVETKENYYGNIYTNIKATLTATSVTGNPIYGSSKPISIEFNKPVVPIPSITVDDNYSSNDIYTIEQGKILNIKEANGILKNDKLTKVLDAGATVTDKIVLVTDNTTGDLKNINMDILKGSFTYNAPTDIDGNITYKYYIETTVSTEDNETIVKSNISTITIKITKIPTTYTVHYYKEGTKTKVLKDKKVNNVNVYEEIKEEAIKVDGYEIVGPSSKKLIMSNDKNEFIFYYKANEQKYTVNYLEKETDEILHESVTKDASFNDKIIALDEKIKIAGYTYDSLIPTTLEITKDNDKNVINIYYKKRNDFSYTVNYLERGTNKVLKEPKIVSNQIFKTIIKTSDEIIEIKNYRYDSTDNKSLTISTGENIINIYYKNNTGSVKSVYVDKNGKEISEFEIITGEIDTEYKTFKKAIDKYKLVETKGNEKGKYIDREVLVTYIYEKVPETGVYKREVSKYLSVLSVSAFVSLLILKKKLYS